MNRGGGRMRADRNHDDERNVPNKGKLIQNVYIQDSSI